VNHIRFLNGHGDLFRKDKAPALCDKADKIICGNFNLLPACRCLVFPNHYTGSAVFFNTLYEFNTFETIQAASVRD